MRSWFFTAIVVMFFHSFSFAEDLDSSRILSYEALVKLSLEERTEYLQGVQELMIELENIEIEKKMSRTPQAASIFSGLPISSKTNPKKVVCEKIPGHTMRLVPYRVYKAKPTKPSWYESLSSLLIPYVAPEDPKDFACIAPLTFEFSCPDGLIPGAASWQQTIKIKSGEKWDPIRKTMTPVYSDYQKGKRFRCFTPASFNSLSEEKRKYLQRHLQEEIAFEKEQAQRQIQKRVEPEEKPVYISSQGKIEKLAVQSQLQLLEKNSTEDPIAFVFTAVISVSTEME